MLHLQQPPVKTQLDHSLALLGFMQSQWNQTWMHLLQTQQHASQEAMQFQWMAAQPPADYARALVESVMAASRHFVNGADQPKSSRTS